MLPLVDKVLELVAVAPLEVAALLLVPEIVVVLLEVAELVVEVLPLVDDVVPVVNELEVVAIDVEVIVTVGITPGHSFALEYQV